MRSATLADRQHWQGGIGAEHYSHNQGHPDPAGGHLCHALADAYAQGAVSAGHSVSRVDVAALDFPLLRTKAEFETGRLPEALLNAKQALQAADHIVVIFPLWLGTMPALLKGLLEHLMRPGIAFEYRSKGFPKKLLKGKSARLVVTMGMPALFFRWFSFSHGLRGLKRNILAFVGIRPVRESLFGTVEGASTATIARWLEQMRRLGAKAR
jgi:putative NADPH-quinone reductase